MEKYMITGFSGFVSRHFLSYLGTKNERIEILGIDMESPSFDYKTINENIRVRFLKKNLLDDNMYEIIMSFQPDYILHLASYSSVAYSWKNPIESFLNNTNIFLNIVDAVYRCKMNTRILSVGSSEEYGNVELCDLPIREKCEMLPVNPYAVARFSQEHLSRVYVNGYGLNIIMTRSFNHIGEDQDDRFVIPSFVKRIMDIKKRGEKRGVIETGDLTIVRDFTNVDDVVEAYYILLHEGRVGEVYNICSGKGETLSDIVKMISDICGVEINTAVNPQLVRPNDNKIIYGSYEKINSEFGWYPKIGLEATIKKMIEQYEQ